MSTIINNLDLDSDTGDIISQLEDQNENQSLNLELDGDGIPVYRFFRNDTETQFYTTTEVEREVVLETLPQYELEGISFIGAEIPEEDIIGINPIYRFFNQDTGIHLYTADENERAFVEENLDNYVFEGTPYYGYDTQMEGTVPLYRFYNSGLDAHFYTPSIEERDFFIESPDYQPEGSEDGIAFYVEPISEEDEVDSLTGAEIQLQVFFPDFDSPGTVPLIREINDEVEYTELPSIDLPGFNLVDVNIDLNFTTENGTISFEVDENENSGTFGAGDVNTYVFTDISDEIPAIENVTINELATTLGLEASDITFTENTIEVNVESLSFAPGLNALLNVDFANDTIAEEPEVEEPISNPNTPEPLLDGLDIQLQVFSPNLETPISEAVTTTIGNGVEFETLPSIELPGETLVDVSIDIVQEGEELGSILFEVDENETFSSFRSASFNGYVFTDISDEIPAIENVTIDELGTTLGLETSDITFTENTIEVNVESLSFVPGDTLLLNLDFADM